MNFLVDTCVISEVISRRPNDRVVKWIDSIDPDSVFLSALTLGEIRRGIEQAKDLKRKSQLDNWLKSELLVRFHNQIVAIDTEVVLVWGELTGRLAVNGTPMPAVDSLIAATAIHYDFMLVTRNVSDFRHSGVKMFNPWEQLGK